MRSQRRTMAMAVMATIAATTAGAAHADDAVGGAWYVAPTAQWWQLDNKREAAGHIAGQLDLGYSFARNLAVELEGGGASFAATCGCALTLKKLSVDLLVKFLPGTELHPYLIVGAGGIEDREDRLPKTTAASVEGGGGLLYDFGASWHLRGEIKYQHEFHDLTAATSNVGDVVYGIGIQYSF